MKYLSDETRENIDIRRQEIEISMRKCMMNIN